MIDLSGLQRVVKEINADKKGKGSKLFKALESTRKLAETNDLADAADSMLIYDEYPESDVKSQVKKHVGSANPKQVKKHFNVDAAVEKVREKEDSGDMLRPPESRLLSKLKSKAVEKKGDEKPKVIEKKSTFIKEPGKPPFFEEKQRMTKKPQPEELDFIKNYKSPDSGAAIEDDSIFDLMGLASGIGAIGSIGKGLLSKIASKSAPRLLKSLAEKEGIRKEAIERALKATRSSYGKSARGKDSAGVKSSRERLIELEKVKDKVSK